MTTSQLAFLIKTAVAIKRFAKRHYRWRGPRVLLIEDEDGPRKDIADTIKQVFPDACYGVAGCIREGRDEFEKESRTIGSRCLDLVLMDYKLPALDRRDNSAEPELLAAWFEEVLQYQKLFRLLVLITAYLDEAIAVKDRIINAPRSTFERTATQRVLLQQEYMKLSGKLELLEKKEGYIDIILAYIYRVLAIDWRDSLLGEMGAYDFDLLSGYKLGPRIRSGELPGTDDFRDFVARLEIAWPFVAHWPESEDSETKMLLNDLARQVREHFHVDESGYNMETGVGKVRLELKLRDPLPRGKGGHS